MEQIDIVTQNSKLRPWQYVAKDIIAALTSVEAAAGTELAAAVERIDNIIDNTDAQALGLKQQIAANASDIASLSTAVASNADAIASNAQAISDNASAIATNASAIATNAAAIATNASAIQALQTTYASTDTYGLTKVTDSIAQVTEIQSGMAASPKAVYDAIVAANSYADTLVGNKIANAYKFKGSVNTIADLPASDAEGLEVGDVYNVKFGGDETDDGANFAWDGTQWDSLGGIMQVEQSITAGNASSISPISVAGAKSYVDGQISLVNGAITTINTTIDNTDTQALGLKQLIAANATAIASNADAIASNAQAISDNASAIATNASAISALDTRLDGLDGGDTPAQGRVTVLEDQMNASSTGVLARLGALETGAPSAVTAQSVTNETVTVTSTSSTVQILNTNGAVTLAFTAAGSTVYSVKEILLHAVTNTTLTVTGAVFADAEEDPDWGVATYELYLRVTFINGEVILQILSNSQEAHNANVYVSDYGTVNP